MSFFRTGRVVGVVMMLSWVAACGLFGRAAVAQCGVLLQEDATIPGNVRTFQAAITFDFDGEGPLAAEFLVGGDRGRVFAWNGTRWRQVGQAIARYRGNPPVPEPLVADFAILRGRLYALAVRTTGYEGTLFRWDGFAWTQIDVEAPCNTNASPRRMTAWNDRLVFLGSTLVCAGEEGALLTYDGFAWELIPTSPFTAFNVSSVLGTSDGRLLAFGWTSTASVTDGYAIVEFVSDVWEYRYVAPAVTCCAPTLRLEEVRGEVLAIGLLRNEPSGGYTYVLRETSRGWERAFPLDETQRRAMAGAFDVIDVGTSWLIAGPHDLFDNLAPTVLGELDADNTWTTVPLPDGGHVRYTGGFARHGDSLFALGSPGYGQTGGTLHRAAVSGRPNFEPLPPLLSTTIYHTTPAPELVRGVMFDGQIVGQADVGGGLVIRDEEGWHRFAGIYPGPIRNVLVYNGELVAVGGQSGADADRLSAGLARWNGTQWVDFNEPFEPARAYIRDGTVWNGRLVVIAETTPNTSPIRVRAWDGQHWTDVGEPFSHGLLFACTAGGRLYVAVSRRIYEWSGTAWIRLGDDTTTPSNLLGWSEFAGRLVVRGTGSTGLWGTFTWDGTAWVAPWSQPIGGGTVEFQGTSYLGRGSNGSTTNPALMRLEGDTWVPAIALGTFPVRDDVGMGALLPDGDTLHLLGQFYTLAGFTYESYARFYAGPPRLLTQPVDARVRRGRTAYFSVEPEVYHDPVQDYQWRRDGTALVDGATPGGSVVRRARTPYLQIALGGAGDLGRYDCVVSNGCGVTASGAGELRAACVADVDDGSGSGTPDGGVTVDDLLHYLVQYAAGAVAADVDDGSGTGTPDGAVTIDDLLYYLGRYQAGC